MSVQQKISESVQIAEQKAPGVSVPLLRLPVRYVEGIYNRDNHGSAPGSIICADDWFLATVEDAPNAVAKAAFIISAVNSHDALVKALEEIAALDAPRTDLIGAVKRVRHIAKCALASAREVQP